MRGPHDHDPIKTKDGKELCRICRHYIKACAPIVNRFEGFGVKKNGYAGLFAKPPMVTPRRKKISPSIQSIHLRNI